MKKEKLIPFVMPVLCILLGILAYLTANQALQIICRIVGGTLILIGIVGIIRYLLRSPEENFASNDFLIGFILLLLGITAIIKAQAVSHFIPFVLGFLIAVNGIRELQNAIDVHKLGLSNQWIVVLVAVVNLILGIVLMVNPGLAADILMKVVGGGLVISGIADLVTTIVVLGKGSRHE